MQEKRAFHKSHTLKESFKTISESPRSNPRGFFALTYLNKNDIIRTQIIFYLTER